MEELLHDGVQIAGGPKVLDASVPEGDEGVRVEQREQADLRVEEGHLCVSRFSEPYSSHLSLEVAQRIRQEGNEVGVFLQPGGEEEKGSGLGIRLAQAGGERRPQEGLEEAAEVGRGEGERLVLEQADAEGEEGNRVAHGLLLGIRRRRRSHLLEKRSEQRDQLVVGQRNGRGFNSQASGGAVLLCVRPECLNHRPLIALEVQAERLRREGADEILEEVRLHLHVRR